MKKHIQAIDWTTVSRKDFNRTGDNFEFSLRDMCAATLSHHALTQSAQVFEMTEQGHVEEDEKDEKGLRFLHQVEKLGGRLFYKHFSSYYYECLFVYDHGMVQVELSNNYLKVSGLSFNEKFIDELRESMSGSFIVPEQKGHIFAIVRQGQHLHLASVGNASIPLETGNYTSAVLEDYNYVINDLQSESPSGRIVIMEGEPGTGKTHLIRALLRDVPDAMFVLVSPEIVPELAGPDLLPLLLSNKHNYAVDGPIVLVLEDADQCLTTRGGDNINSIQSLLNLGDGILGSLLDLRIVATTNAKKLEMEAAILRPGRLSKRLEVGALDFKTARGVFRRLLPDVAFPDVLAIPPLGQLLLTLAEVYSMARKHGWQPKLREVSDKKKDNSIASEDDIFD